MSSEDCRTELEGFPEDPDVNITNVICAITENEDDPNQVKC